MKAIWEFHRDAIWIWACNLYVNFIIGAVLYVSAYLILGGLV